MKWCCVSFKANYEAAGDRGFALLVERDADGDPRFLIQHRAMKLGEEQKTGTTVPVSLVSQTGLRYCPWCGRRLARWYKRQVDALTRPGLGIELEQESPD